MKAGGLLPPALLATTLAALAAAAADIPLRNWHVPGPGKAGPALLADRSNPLFFVPVDPCRIVDTRESAPILGGTSRSFVLVGGACGLPPRALSFSLNFTVVAPAAYTDGFLTAYPTGTLRPVVSTLNYGTIVANAAVVPSFNGTIDVYLNQTAHVVIDVNGYYTNTFKPDEYLGLTGSYPGGGLIFAHNTSPFAESASVRGYASGAGTVYGVLGELTNPDAAAGAAGVRGIASASASATYGVTGSTSGGPAPAAGVRGQDSPAALPVAESSSRSGVYGVSKAGVGVEGLSENAGVRGELYDGGGALLALGLLGFASGGTPFGVFSSGPLHATGAITGASKSFVQPHPVDATREINYVSLEGRASEVYFRGSIEVAQGTTVLPIPEDFRLVARPGSYSTVATPVGRAQVWVVEEGENGIVLESTRAVKVNYVVFAEREAFPDHAPVQENTHFVPESEKGFLGLPESYLRLMTRNGALNPDGTVNPETAERAGWKRTWDQRKEKGFAPVATTPQKAAPDRR